MDRAQRFRILAEAAADDRETGLPARASLNEGPVGIRPVRLPGGGSTTLMRVMQTNACSLSCGYCPTFCGGRVKRTALSPEEVARTFMESHRSGVAQGLFLTSGVPGRAPRAVDRMLAAVEILRRREGFAGYVHIKMLPGAERDQVIAATRLATRVSVNLEGPNDAVVRGLAREKDYSGDLLPTLTLAGRLSREARLEGRPGIAAAGTTTQFVVGAQGERDREILGVVGGLERQGLLHHAHFSAFQPVEGTPMEGLPPTPAAREWRLYQAEHLLRQYGPRGGAGLRGRRQPGPRARSEDGVGAGPCGAVSGGARARTLRAAAAGAGDRAHRGPASGGRAPSHAAARRAGPPSPGRRRDPSRLLPHVARPSRARGAARRA